MVDVKEIKSIELVPFTLMTSSISAILALIYAIILLLTFGILAAVIPAAGLVFASLGLSMIVIFPIGSFPDLHYTIICNCTHLQHVST